MKTSLVSVSGIATLAVAVSFWCLGRPSPSHPTAHPATPTAHAAGAKLLGRLPVAFVPNLGQWEHAASYVARIGAMTVFLGETGGPSRWWSRRQTRRSTPRAASRCG